MQATATTPVLVVLVAHDGLEWLPRTLDALDAQTHDDLTIVAVDNASQDGSRGWLVDRLGPDRVLLAERDIGFPAAVSMALDATSLHDAPYVLFLHDDCALEPDALAGLVAALEDDPRLGLVGAKLRSWEDPSVLQSAGWTIDLTGRADSGVDPGELDQGQRDRERRALYVSTAGMLVRREVFDQLGRFDRRFHLFRDDLDLCWRAWLAGHDVEVVPEAVAYHRAGATNYVRLGQTRFIGPRYFAERNTLASLLRNYGAARLWVVIPLYLLVGLAKVAGFLLTRRVSDAWQTVRAWLWNLYHLRGTWRLRRVSQRSRTRRDRELAPLFGRIAPRIRAYVEAIAEWIAGGDVAPSAPPATRREAPQEPEPAVRRLVRLTVRRPVAVAAAAIVTLLAVSGWPLLAPGSLRGGELAAWPASPMAFLGDHAASWHAAGAFGSALPPSPAQALLGLVHLLVGGNTYLAPRVLLFGSVLVAWLLALRAVQPFSRRKLPRVVAATAYVLSPPALAALVTGRVGALVVLAVLPGIAAAGNTLLRPSAPPGRAWRAVAAAILLAAIGTAFEPFVLVLVLAAVAVAVAVTFLRGTDADALAPLMARLGAVAVGPVVLLLPWSLRLLDADGPLRGATGVVVVDPLWRWLVLSPELAGFPGVIAGVGFVLAGLLGLALGSARAGRMVVGLWSVAAFGALLAWLLGRSGQLAWPGLPMLLTAGAFAGLLALAFATGAGHLGRHAFGWRQVASLATSLAVAGSIATVAWSLLGGPWDAYVVDDDPLPAFVTADEALDTFRVLVLADDDAGRVTWEVVPGSGPTMAAYGVTDDAATVLLAPIVEDLTSGADPGAGARLGRLGVRYVVVPETGASDALDRLLDAQLGLEPRPVTEGRVLTVPAWQPRAAIVAADALAAAGPDGVLPGDAEVVALRADGPGRFVGRSTVDGTVLVAEQADPAWEVRAGGRSLSVDASDTIAAVGVEAGDRVEVVHAGDGRGRALTGQLLVLLLTISLVLRPPRLAQRRAARRRRRSGDPVADQPPPPPVEQPTDGSAP